MIELVLVDVVPDLVACWMQAFQACPEVTILHDHILAVAENALVSPANSYGFMDGGIDQQYLDYFGLELQTRVMQAIARRREGYLPVGASLIVATGHARIPYLIVAPTMTIPEPVHPSHSYRALAAALRMAQQHPGIQRVVLSWPEYGRRSGTLCIGSAGDGGRVPRLESAVHVRRRIAVYLSCAGTPPPSPPVRIQFIFERIGAILNAVALILLVLLIVCGAMGFLRPPISWLCEHLCG